MIEGWQKVRKKPVVVKAFQFTKDLYEKYRGKDIFSLNGVPFKVEIHKRERVIRIDTLEGQHNVRPNDYIICGVKGEYYPCAKWVFEETYEVL